jgi:hypothetical protein
MIKTIAYIILGISLVWLLLLVHFYTNFEGLNEAYTSCVEELKVWTDEQRPLYNDMNIFNITFEGTNG